MPFSKHDPERTAAEYLAGLQRPRSRRRFEEHLLECEECWREVRLARLGRNLGEKAREVAPAHLRENVRGAVALAGATSGRRPVRPVAAAAAAALLAIAAVSVLVFTGQDQPQPIAAALAAFRANQMPAGAAPTHDAPDLAAAGLAFQGGAHEMMGGLPVDAFSYRSRQGTMVLLLMSGQPFPVASGAVDRPDVPGWKARADDVTMMCASQPMSYLLLGNDPAVLSRAEQALGVPQLATG